MGVSCKINEAIDHSLRILQHVLQQQSVVKCHRQPRLTEQYRHETDASMQFSFQRKINLRRKQEYLYYVYDIEMTIIIAGQSLYGTAIKYNRSPLCLVKTPAGDYKLWMSPP